ncbi:MAG: AMP-binding protein [Pseudoruegeria sp.]
MTFDLINDIRTQFETRPHHPALHTAGTIWTFAQLAARVQGILDYIPQLETGRPIMVAGHKEADAVAAMMACMFAGRPFVFLDRSNPPSRGQRIIALADVTDVLCAGAVPDLEGNEVHPLDRIQSRKFDGAGCVEVPDDAVLYLIFTSGSMGEPKGVPVSRANFSAFDAWYRPMLSDLPGQGLDPVHRGHVNHASLAFDMGMLDTWPVLGLGRPVIMLDHAHNTMPFMNLAVLKGLIDLRAASWFSTPSLLQLMCTDRKFNAEILPELRCFFVGGEVVQRVLVEEINRRFPDAEIRHAYGPSEVTCMTHVHILTQADLNTEGLLPLGPVLAPNTMRIVDEDGCEVPVGSAGEVELCGPQVVRGYIPHDHPANRAFVSYQGQPAYRTGDFGKVDKKGQLTLLGRIDRQVKWNGNRIELDEIDRAASEISGVQKAACLPVKSDGRVVNIVLFCQFEDECTMSLEALSQSLATRLPQAMVPRDIHVVDHLPVTVNGKLDSQALLAAHQSKFLTDA